MTQTPSPLADTLSTKRLNLILFTILSLFPLIGMGIDLLAPSLPAMSITLEASASITKNLITSYMVGYVSGNFFIGLLTDCFGRRKVFTISLFLFVLASVSSIFTTNLFFLLLLRFIQGVTFGAAGVVSRAIFSDLLPLKRLIQLAPTMAGLWGIGPVIGPAIGGYLQFYFGWQACYVFFSIYGLLVFLGAYFFIPETGNNPLPFNSQQIKQNVLTVVKCRHFMGIGIAMGLTYASIITFHVLCPFLLQEIFHQSVVQYGHIALSMGIFFLINTVVCRYALKYSTPERIIQYLLIGSFIILFLCLLLSLLYAGSLALVLIASYFAFMSSAFVYPCGLARCSSMLRSVAGTNAAVMMLLASGITTVVSYLLSFIQANTPAKLISVYVILTVLGLMAQTVLFKKTSIIEEMEK